MLEELLINNIALVDKLSIRFTPGMNCLTGETGAGKSILAGALGLIRGNKGEIDQIRTGCDEASVSASFSLSNTPEAAAWLAERGLGAEEDTLLVRRVLRRNGKGSLYVQGQPVTLKDLTELAALLFDMHGQHEHQNLFNVDMHRMYLDRWAGLEAQVAEYGQAFANLAALGKKRDQILADEAEIERKREYLDFAVKEIEAAKVQPGEDIALEHDRRIAGQAEKLYSLCTQAREGLSEGEGGSISRLFSAKHALHDLSRIDESLTDLAGRLDSVYYELEDIARSVESYAENAQFDPRSLDDIEDRLALLDRLKKKYGPGLDEVRAFGEKAAQDLDNLANISDLKLRMQKEIKDAEQLVFQKAAQLTARRREASQGLRKVVEESLKGLGMAKTRFEVAVSQKLSERGSPICGLQGADHVEFLLAPNPGEPLKPIRNVASGGEISRIMLAVKGALADSDQVQTLVFDEVDTGIGGEVAVAVGEHLHKLALSKQILAITHLASIAVRADNHIKVEKIQGESRTVSNALLVRAQSRVEEIARMLSGDASGEASLRHAAELLERYHAEY